MPAQFSPASREEVRDKVDSMNDVAYHSACGPGVMIAYKSMKNSTTVFTKLTERYGWYCASYEPKDTGDVAVLMPITEVP